MDEIIAIIIDGKHGGTKTVLPYNPIITMPLTNENQISIGEKDEGIYQVGDNVEYFECFSSVDGKVVLYSENGNSRDLINLFMRKFTPTNPINILTPPPIERE